MNKWDELDKRKKKYGGRRKNDDALGSSYGCRECGAPSVYYDGRCLKCFEFYGGDGPGRDSLG